MAVARAQVLKAHPTLTATQMEQALNAAFVTLRTGFMAQSLCAAVDLSDVVPWARDSALKAAAQLPGVVRACCSAAPAATEVSDAPPVDDAALDVTVAEAPTAAPRSASPRRAPPKRRTPLPLQAAPALTPTGGIPPWLLLDADRAASGDGALPAADQGAPTPVNKARTPGKRPTATPVSDDVHIHQGMLF